LCSEIFDPKRTKSESAKVAPKPRHGKRECPEGCSTQRWEDVNPINWV